MSRIVLLDRTLLGMVSHPRSFPDEKSWLFGLLGTEMRVLIPDIADYEVRRELLRVNRVVGLKRLDVLHELLGSVPITTETLRKAAELWASARRQGRSTADQRALDGDVILAAQAQLAAAEGHEVIVATTNFRHLGWFVDARRWQDIG
jgi:predicted nucleic acid-binding protein